jgi:glycerol dehydrogenase
MIIVRAPRRYVQGPGAIESIGSEVARLGGSAVLVADETVLSLVGSSVASSCQAVGVTLHCLRFGGDVTTAEILRLADQATVDSPDVVIAGRRR